MSAKTPLMHTDGPRNFNTGTSYIRNPKWVVPICDICQAPGQWKPNWFETCTHDPYFSRQSITVPGEEIYEPILDENGAPTGRERFVSRAEDTRESRRMPNTRQMPVTARHATALGSLESVWRNKGRKRPEEVGIAPYCEMRDCWVNTDLIEYRSGTFCGEEHARLVGADQQRKHLDVFNGEKRAAQLAAVSI